MKKQMGAIFLSLVCLQAFSAEFPDVGPIGLSSLLTSGSIAESSDSSKNYKVEKLREEAVLHLAEGRIVNPSQSLKIFIKELKKDEKNKNQTDLEVLENFINQN
jgi:hypothetical protein